MASSISQTAGNPQSCGGWQCGRGGRGLTSHPFFSRSGTFKGNGSKALISAITAPLHSAKDFQGLCSATPLLQHSCFGALCPAIWTEHVLPTHLSPSVVDQFHGPPAFVLNPHKYSSICVARGQFLVWLVPSHQYHLGERQEDIHRGYFSEIIPLENEIESR